MDNNTRLLFILDFGSHGNKSSVSLEWIMDIIMFLLLLCGGNIYYFDLLQLICPRGKDKLSMDTFQVLFSRKMIQKYRI